jgi:hypothetical protein
MTLKQIKFCIVENFLEVPLTLDFKKNYDLTVFKDKFFFFKSTIFTSIFIDKANMTHAVRLVLSVSTYSVIWCGIGFILP